jgi:spermidine synthase
MLSRFRDELNTIPGIRCFKSVLSDKLYDFDETKIGINLHGLGLTGFEGYDILREKYKFIYHDMITHVAMTTNPKIRKVLVIGAVGGGTIRELTKYKNIEKIDMVEIDERVVRLSQQFLSVTAEKLEDPRVTMYFEDELKFVEEEKKKNMI